MFGMVAPQAGHPGLCTTLLVLAMLLMLVVSMSIFNMKGFLMLEMGAILPLRLRSGATRGAVFDYRI